MCSCDQSLVTAAFLWEKLSQPWFYKDLTRKTAFFEGWSWFKFNNLGLTLGTNLKFYTSVVKRLKLKVGEFWGLIPMFVLVEVTGEKLVGRDKKQHFIRSNELPKRQFSFRYILLFCQCFIFYYHIVLKNPYQNLMFLVGLCILHSLFRKI